MRKHQESQVDLPTRHSSDPWEKPLTNMGFIAVLLGVVLGLAQYWQPIVFAGFVLLLAGILLYPVGKLTEKNFGLPEGEPGNDNVSVVSQVSCSTVHSLIPWLSSASLAQAIVKL